MPAKHLDVVSPEIWGPEILEKDVRELLRELTEFASQGLVQAEMGNTAAAWGATIAALVRAHVLGEKLDLKVG